MNTPASQIRFLSIRRKAKTVSKVPVTMVLDALDSANSAFRKYAAVDKNLDIFGLLGMRNLSAFVGEAFVSSLAQVSGGLLKKNPHQDGYPDLLLLDDQGCRIWNTIQNKQDKGPFSPFGGGGIEVKATCGDLPTPRQCQKRGSPKPGIGDTRSSLVRSYTWKAHHRQTNNLVGLLWDFRERVPQIVAIFYSDKLEQSDWGAIVQPHEGGGRTTSVSIMGKDGVCKMAKGCLFCADEETRALIERVTGVSV